jgi:hypothetical protein
MLKGFFLGAITGGLFVWIWKDEIQDYLDSRTVVVRQRAADGLHTVGERAGGVLDRAHTPLRRAEEMLDHGKAHLARNLRTVEETLRPEVPPGS